MKKKVLALLFIILPILSYSQEGEYTILGSVHSLNMANFKFLDEDLGVINGFVKSGNGKAVADAMIVVSNGWYFFDASSNKKGEFRAKSMPGNYTIEISAPGFEKYVEEIVVSRKRPLEIDVTLEPIVKGSEKMKAAGNKSMSGGNSILFNINGKHPAYDGCSLLDVLQNLPLFDEVSGKALKVAGSENVTIHFNSRANKAQPQMLVNMLRSIPAQNVQSVKVSSWGGQGESPILVYLHYKE